MNSFKGNAGLLVVFLIAMMWASTAHSITDCPGVTAGIDTSNNDESRIYSNCVVDNTFHMTMGFSGSMIVTVGRASTNLTPQPAAALHIGMFTGRWIKDMGPAYFGNCTEVSNTGVTMLTPPTVNTTICGVVSTNSGNAIFLRGDYDSAGKTTSNPSIVYGPTPATAPAAPSNVTATAGDTEATVSWTAPSNGGSPITGYTVTSAPEGKTCGTTGATTCTVTGLTNGTAYTFTVIATNDVGDSPASAPSTAVTPATVSVAPSNVTATAGDTEATVSWTAPSETGGSAITGYTVTGAPGGSCTVAGDVTKCTITGLTNGTEYTFTVVATNDEGNSLASAQSNPVTPAAPSIATIAQTQRVLQNYAANRVRHITAQGPGISGFLDGDGMGGSVAGLIDSPVALAFNGEASGGFSTSLQQFSTFTSSLNTDGNGSNVNKTISSPANLWIKGRWSKIKDDRGGLSNETDFGIIYLGADYRYSDDLLIGVMAQADWFDESVATINSQAEGNGWMLGPYLVARLKDSLVMDLRVAWGQSDNKVNPLGTYWDNYDGERWQVEGNLTGSFKEGKWLVAPTLGLNYFKDIQKSYVDSNGFTIPEATTELGTLNFGPKISYLAEGHDGTLVYPFVTVKGVWDFKAPDIYDISGIASGTEKLRGQAGIGVSVLTTHGTSIQASYTYDGIGIDDYESHSVDLLANISLKNTAMPKGSSLSASYSLTNILMIQSVAPQSSKIQLMIPFN